MRVCARVQDVFYIFYITLSVTIFLILNSIYVVTYYFGAFFVPEQVFKVNKNSLNRIKMAKKLSGQIENGKQMACSEFYFAYSAKFS